MILEIDAGEIKMTKEQLLRTLSERLEKLQKNLREKNL